MRSIACLLLLMLPVFVGISAEAEKHEPGSKVSRFTFKDTWGLPRTLDEFKEQKAFVLVFTTVGCPIVNRYFPRLAELSRQFHDQGVQFLAVDVGQDDTLRDIAFQALDHGIDFPFVKDSGGECARALGAKYTPEVVVLDRERVIRYRGRINDQYRLGGAKPTASREDLQTALEKVLAGGEVSVSETIVEGCAITIPQSKPKKTDLSYTKDVAPIFQRHCVECHHPGTEAPFSLTTYEKVVAKAGTIAEAVEDLRMPPWYAHPEFGEFVNARVLSTDERSTIVGWARGDKARGKSADVALEMEKANSSWHIGEPDLVLTASAPEELPASGYIPYRYVILPYIFPHDTWVQGIEIKPGNPKVLHHANLAYASLANGFDEQHNFLTGKVPGGIPVKLDSGVAMMIPKGEALALQIHYVTTGKPERDLISVGLRFAREPIMKRVRYKILANYRFKIPPGAPFWPASAVKELECDATGIALFTHMHLRGKDSTFTAHYPGGRDERLLVIPNYNFDWQLSYVWSPGQKHFPKGTKIECLSHFDNSVFNPYNPDPTATVKNGLQTNQEMMQGFLFYTDDSEKLDIRVDPKTGKQI